MMNPFSVWKRDVIVWTVTPLLSGLIIGQAVWSQPEGDRRPPPSDDGPGPNLRFHEVTQSDGKVRLVTADVAPAAENWTSIEISDGKRLIRANGIPRHNTGMFPNTGNPNAIIAQSYTYSITTQPKMTGNIAPLRGAFGVCINGVPLDPGAAEFFHGDRDSGWQYEALSGAVALGLDTNHAHVQPNGAYHYHAKPTLLTTDLNLDSAAHSPLIGWAADGFPIYACFGFGNDGSTVHELVASYRIKSGNRSDGEGEPGGSYDGTFTRDYEYVDGWGDLDECNGQQTTTPEFPDGTYAYFLTHQWPYIPRCHMGTPSDDFAHGHPEAPSTAVLRESWGRIKTSADRTSHYNPAEGV